MPKEDEHDNAINPKELMASLSGYATRLANLVNLGVFYKAYPDPHLDQGGTSSSANVGGNGAPDVEPSPGILKKLPKMPAWALKTRTSQPTRQPLLESFYLSCN